MIFQTGGIVTFALAEAWMRVVVVVVVLLLVMRIVKQILLRRRSGSPKAAAKGAHNFENLGSYFYL
tara:strand:- start:254 stop:451 length:198 start_codon:yes stop_codon:yes gene_type:complete